MENCIFCKIVAGTAPSHKVWEDDRHIAFLTIFPNTDGFTVVATKAHKPSYIADASEDVSNALFDAMRTVAKKIDAAFDDVGRTGFIFEGFGVDHLHGKLFPMHDTKSDAWKERDSHVPTFFEKYEGYISSHNGARADDVRLAEIAEKIRASL